MAPRSPTSRSTASASTNNNRRPKSRQSTTSIQSVTTQPARSYQQNATASSFPIQSQAHSQMYQGTPEEMISRSSHQLANPNEYHAIDPALQFGAPNPVQYDSEPNFGHGPDMNTPILGEYNTFEGRDSLGPDARNEDQDLEEQLGDGSRRKKGSATSQANDIELRRLFREHEGKSLKEVAVQVLEKKSEKTKQIFGMLWLSTYCKRSTGSVPRNRVFAQYADRCGSERVPPLNPASFGKLVRIIFPGISTRRLGVRGESKYHYVELVLSRDLPELANTQRSQSVNINKCSAQHVMEGNNIPSQRPRLPADTALFPSPGSPFIENMPTSVSHQDMSLVSVPIFLKTRANGGFPLSQQMVNRLLHFPSPVGYSKMMDGPLKLPSIDPYLPEGADPDAAKQLTSVYRAHCLNAIENFRFCKSNEFFDSYKSLCGLLTVPGLRLLGYASVAEWIKQCDWLKYQKMMPILEKAILAQVPSKVMSHFDTIRVHLCDRISDYFQNQPDFIKEAMLGPATIFTSLLQRMLRVHRSALDVASALDSDANRGQLWSDWVTLVDPLYIVQTSIMKVGHKRVVYMMAHEFREILSSVQLADLKIGGTIFDPYYQDSLAATLKHSRPVVDFSLGYVDRLTRFLGSLPSRFPGVNAKYLLHYVDLVGNSISRNLTMNGAESLSTWWRIKVFLDEMSYWLAEKGGFLEFGPESMRVPFSPTAQHFFHGGNGSFDFDDGNGDLAQSRPRTAGADARSRFGSEDVTNGGGRSHDRDLDREHSIAAAITNHLQGHPGHHHKGNVVRDDRPKGQGQSQSQSHRPRSESTILGTPSRNSFGHDQDDSGIGMGLDEDFGMEKYNGFVDTVQGSDPADVVVC